ncbi:hypothetical protein D9758_013145 [Tetrapyrgos nigripes]|uniref:DUF6534 domain-containing protein n=1 Tax=Tetrapyrgos nigripes TaxID=182062 RepID=A0A8H5CEM1_9AGAR|nr:hypothetical protein D9758_013145 [Tetrapyrgos nigripes]
MDVNAMLGTTLIGTWVNVMLYMLEIIQIYKYFTHYYSSDRRVFQVAVIIVFLVDTVCTIAECAAFYLYSVVHWGEPDYMNGMPWPIPVYVASTGITALIVQVFMLHRFWVLTRRVALACGIALMVITALVGSMMVAALTGKYSSNSQRFRTIVPAHVWLISSAAADIVIAIALGIQFASTEIPSVSKRLGRRLAILSLKTGTITSVFAVASTIVYATNRQTNAIFTICFCIGRLYSLTLLYNLNVRFSVRRGSTTLNVESLSLSDRSTRTGSGSGSGSGNASSSRPENTKISALTSISSQLYPSSSSCGPVDEWGIRAPTPAIIVDEALRDAQSSSQKYGYQSTSSSTQSLPNPSIV